MCHTGRWSVGKTGRIDDAAHSLDDCVVRGIRGHRAGLAEARRRSIDQSGVDARKLLVGEPESLHCAGAIVLRQNVGLTHHVQENSPVAFCFQIKHDTFFATVHETEIKRLVSYERT